MDFSIVINSLPMFLNGTIIALKLLFLSLLCGGLLSVPLAIACVRKNLWFSRSAGAYIYFFCGTPLLVQLFFIYYGIAQFQAVRESFIWPVLRDPFNCAVLAFSLHTAAYTAGILRGALQSIHASEIEAARAIGLSGFKIYTKILLPKAFQLSLPAYGNEVVGMLKGTSLASTITIMEITGVARTMVSRTFAPYEFFILAGLIYLSIAVVLSILLRTAEHFLTPHLRPRTIS